MYAALAASGIIPLGSGEKQDLVRSQRTCLESAAVEQLAASRPLPPAASKEVPCFCTRTRPACPHGRLSRHHLLSGYWIRGVGLGKRGPPLRPSDVNYNLE